MNLTRDQLRSLDEKALREDVLVPLFTSMGFKDVTVHHGGILEQGKDLVMWRPDVVRARLNFAVVAKVTTITGQATGKSSAAEVYAQVKQCFGKPFTDPTTLEDCPVDHVYVVTSKEILKEARESLRSLLGADGYDRAVDLIDGDRLWALIQQHLPESVVLDRLSEVAKTLDGLSPHYRVVAKTGLDGVSLSIEPKSPDAASHESAEVKLAFAFPDTPEGRAQVAAMERWMKTGEAVEIPAAFIRDFQPPRFLSGLMAQKELHSVRLGPREAGHRLIMDLSAVASDGSGAVTLAQVELRSVRGGTEEVLLSNSHQAVPWHFTVTLRRQQRLLHFKVEFDFLGCNARQYYDALRFARALSVGAELTFRGAESGLSYFRTLLPGGGIETPPATVLEFAHILVQLQERLGAPLSLPRRTVEAAEFVLASELLTKVTTGQWTERISDFKVLMDREGVRRALQALERGAAQSLSMVTSESHELFGTPVQLGEARYTMTDMTITDEDRHRTEAALADPQVEHAELRYVATDSSQLLATYPLWQTRGPTQNGK